MATRHNNLRGCVIVIILAVLRSSVSESNVANLTTAIQSSNHDKTRWLASAAVDGCVQTSITSGCCAHTKASSFKTAWWQVNLGGFITINSIKIYYRDNSQKRFAGYQLYVSNTTTTPPDGVLCYKDTSSTEADVQLIVTHQCPSVGQYVTVYNSRNTSPRYDGTTITLFWNCVRYRCGGVDMELLVAVTVTVCVPGTVMVATVTRRQELVSIVLPEVMVTSVIKLVLYLAKNSTCEKDSGNCYDCIAQKHGVQCET
ncbi:uncharacterized protein [Argopecten irradians]|uniref:uncharacterized protein isoform X2 n=1 Tax=Argopecten irradians TaxID=31199 RepID=UPI0037235CFE